MNSVAWTLYIKPAQLQNGNYVNHWIVETLKSLSLCMCIFAFIFNTCGFS